MTLGSSLAVVTEFMAQERGNPPFWIYDPESALVSVQCSKAGSKVRIWMEK